MAYDQTLETRIDGLRPDWSEVTKQKMFGGLGYLMGGHMCVGIYKDWLVVRCGPEAYQQSLLQPGAKPFDITGRAMTGWVMVDQEALEDQSELDEWLTQAEGFVRTLPPK